MNLKRNNYGKDEWILWGKTMSNLAEKNKKIITVKF